MDKKNFTISGKKITFDNGNTIELDFDIQSHLLVEDILIIVLGIPGGTDLRNNAYGIDVKENKIIWQVEKYPYQDKPFNSVSLTLTNEVGLRGSRDVIIDPITGKIVELLPGYK